MWCMTDLQNERLADSYLQPCYSPTGSLVHTHTHTRTTHKHTNLMLLLLVNTAPTAFIN